MSRGMTTTYDGLTGRVIGFVWGLIWFSVGCVGLGYIGVPRWVFRVLPTRLGYQLYDVAPWLWTDTGTFDGSLLLFLGLALGSVLVFGYGLFHIGRVFLVQGYSITLSSGRGGGRV